MNSEKIRYKVEWSHHLCHPETCSHLGDYRIFDNVNKNYIEYSDDKSYLIKKCTQYNEHENHSVLIHKLKSLKEKNEIEEFFVIINNLKTQELFLSEKSNFGWSESFDEAFIFEKYPTIYNIPKKLIKILKNEKYFKIKKLQKIIKRII